MDKRPVVSSAEERQELNVALRILLSWTKYNHVSLSLNLVTSVDLPRLRKF